MAKPTDDISWATAATYDAGSDPWSGQATTAEPVSGRKTQGWEPGKKPGAQTQNWWQRGVKRWVDWLANLFDDSGHLLELDTYFGAGHLLELYLPITVNRFPTPTFISGNFSVVSGLSGGDSGGNMALVAGSGSAVAYCDLEIPVGYRLNSVTVLACGSGSVGVIVGVAKLPTATGAGVLIATKTSPASATAADMTIPVYGKTSGVSLVVGGTALLGLTYTRTVGSFITDGFAIGQLVSVSGFSNVANNFTNHSITGLTATVMTISSAVDSVAETSSAGVIEVTDSMCTSSQTLALLVEAISASGAGIRSLRYNMQKIP